MWGGVSSNARLGGIGRSFLGLALGDARDRRRDVTPMSQSDARPGATVTFMPVFVQAGRTFGSSPQDIHHVLLPLSAEGEIALVRCGCGGKRFRMSLGSRGGSFVCRACHEATLLGKPASEAVWTCGCGGQTYAVMLASDDDGRRKRIGARCEDCGLLSLPAEWPPRAPRMAVRARDLV